MIVVEVDGGRLEADRVREAIGRELSTSAVGPDDPRAMAAKERIEVRVTGKTLTVTYRKTESAVTRTVDLPDENARAESAAVMLAGNVARDEASELVGAPRPSAPGSAPASAPVLDTRTNAERDLAQMRAFLVQSADDERSGRYRLAIGAFIASAALLAPSIYIATTDDPSDAARVFSRYGIAVGAGLAVGTIIQLAIGGSLHEPLARKLEDEARRSDPEEVVKRVEADWERRANEARSMRRLGGVLSMVVGTGLVGLATTLVFVAGPREDGPRYETAAIFYGLGTLNLLLGAASYTVESPIESSHRMWKTIKTAAPPTPPVSVGVAPLPGGGALSFGMSF